MPRQEKSPKKKSKKSEEEDPAMDPAAINELVKNAIDQANAEADAVRAEQKLEERPTAPREETTKQHWHPGQEEMIELQYGSIARLYSHRAGISRIFGLFSIGTLGKGGV